MIVMIRGIRRGRGREGGDAEVDHLRKVGNVPRSSGLYQSDYRGVVTTWFLIWQGTRGPTWQGISGEKVLVFFSDISLSVCA